MKSDLINRFNEALWNAYKIAKKEVNYNATRFLQMFEEHGGLETAHILINSPRVSEGYTKLWELKRLDLTIEAIIFDNPEYHELFTEDELRIVKKRLVDFKYPPALK